jgi:flagellar motor switch protein FliG
MTKLLQKAFTIISMRLNQEDQDRLACLIIENIGKLHQLLEDEIEEKSFDLSAVKALESETVQNLLKKVAEKHGAQNPF